MGFPVLGALLTPTAQPPSISGSVQTTSQVSGTSLAPTIPAHIAGNVLMVFVACIGGTALTASAGWTEEAQSGALAANRLALFTRTATAPGHTITITNNNNSGLTVHAYVLQGAQGDVDATALANSGDPPSHTNGWGAIGNLWFAGCTVSTGSAPTGFINATATTIGSGGGKIDLTTCTKIDDAATLNPSAFSAGGGADASITACARPL